MKKVISILLVVAMAASLCVTAFAANAITITKRCDECGRDTLQYQYEVESFNRVIECPDHGDHDAEEYYVYHAYECFKCCRYWVDYSDLVERRHKCI